MAIKLNNALRDAMLDEVITAISPGELKVYDGAQPTTGGGATTANLLVTFSGISWGSSTGGTSSIMSTAGIAGTSATAGTAVWARLSGTDGTTYAIDGNVGTASTEGNFVISTLSFLGDTEITLTELTLIQPGE